MVGQGADAEAPVASRRKSRQGPYNPDVEGISRRRLLGWLGAAGLGAAAGASGVGLAGGNATAESSGGEIVPFHGTHQAGIATSQQTHVLFAALDVADASLREIHGLLGYWTESASRMTQGRPGSNRQSGPRGMPWDTGEAVGLGPNRLTLTFGVGPGLFLKDDADRFGLAMRRPAPLIDLPPFRTDRLDPARSGGDLCIQACADDPQVAFHGIRELLRLSFGHVKVRWMQAGFLPQTAGGATPRNLLGFMDGTHNLRGTDAAALRRFVWVGSEGPSWMRGGTYLVARRITMRIDKWDGSSLHEQETTIGRNKSSGAPLGGRREHDPVNPSAIPRSAHISVAGPASNGGERILRRGYSFNDGTDGQGGIDAGLFFMAYQRDPVRQFVAIQNRLSTHDALNEYISHTGSAIFAMFPGVQPGGSFGRGLL